MTRRVIERKRWGVYIEWNDLWIGAYRGTQHWYVCLVPCIVIRWERRG